MFVKITNRIRAILSYYKNPRYVVIQGVTNGNRAVMSLGARPLEVPNIYYEEIRIHGYCDKTVLENCISYQNQPNMSWYKSRIYTRVWSFKELMRWRRLLPSKGFRTLEKIGGKWYRIKE